MAAGRRVVVGFDGSDFSMQALDWALDEAELRRLPLTVAHAWQWPYGAADEAAKRPLRSAAEHVLWHGADCARASSSIGDVATDLFEGPAEEHLVALSAGAELVVVGSRGLSGLVRPVIGSVATHVASYARCPVIVVRGTGAIPAAAHHHPIVVGVDRTGPPAVLEFAFQEAMLRSLPLVVAHAVPPASPAPAAAGTAEAAEAEAATAEAVRAAETAVRTRLGPVQQRYPQVAVEVRVTAAPVREMLRAAWEAATLLVLGGATLARPGYLGGAVRAALRHSMCPVAVVPEPPPS